MNSRAVRLLVVAGALLVAGWLLILAQVVHVVPPGFLASFAGHGMSFAGLCFGLGGIVDFVQFRRRSRDVDRGPGVGRSEGLRPTAANKQPVRPGRR